MLKNNRLLRLSLTILALVLVSGSLSYAKSRAGADSSLTGSVHCVIRQTKVR